MYKKGLAEGGKTCPENTLSSLVVSSLIPGVTKAASIHVTKQAWEDNNLAFQNLRTHM